MVFGCGGLGERVLSLFWKNRCVVWSLVCAVPVLGLCVVCPCVCVCVCAESDIYQYRNDVTTASETVRKQIE